MKQLFTLLLFTMLMVLPVSAGEPAVKLVFTDGTSSYIVKEYLSKVLLNEEVEGSYYVHPINKDENIRYIAYEKSCVARIELNAEYVEDAINSLNGAANLVVANEMVSAQSLPAGTMIGIYTADGRCVASQKASNGNANLSISGFSHGTYIVRAGNISFKFMK